MAAHKFTPGPWFLDFEVEECLQTGHVGISAASHGLIAQVVWQMEDDRDAGRNSPQQQATAHLIAAAPDLFEALQGASDLLHAVLAVASDRVDAAQDPRLTSIRAALRKALGDQA